MMAMISESLKNSPNRPVRLFYQLRDSTHAPFLEGLRKLAMTERDRFRLFVAFSNPKPGDLLRGDMQGRMDAVAILGAAGSAAGNYMICGPDDFMRGIAAGLTDRGVPKTCVEFESFMSATKLKSPALASSSLPNDRQTTNGNLAIATQSMVRFTKSACDAVWTDDDSSLLDLAERCGVPVESACRSGQCGSCVKRLLAGKVTYGEPHSYEPLETDEVLTCVAQPVGDIVLDA